MRIYQTAYQQEVAKLYPTKLDFETIAHQRGLLKTKEEKLNYYQTVMGTQGEAIVLDYLQKYGKKHWVVMQNLWQNYSGRFEMDIILFTRHKSYTIEIKNYKRKFTYEAGKVKINGRTRSSNPFHQARRAYTNLENICLDHSYPTRFQGVVVFVGVDNHVEIHSEMTDLEIVPRTRLLTFIEEIAEEEAQYTGEPLDVKRIIRQLEKYETENDYLPEPVTKEKMATARKGICCENCQSYSVENKKHKVICRRCGVVENREKAIVRTICEYGVLNFKSNLTLKPLFEFFGGQVSKSYLFKNVHKHFTVIKNGRHSYILNEKFPYQNIAEQFNFSKDGC